MEQGISTDGYLGLVTRSVQLTAQACSAWSCGDWTRGATLILQAADLEEAALAVAPASAPSAA